jgi:hypothetical protein
VEGDGFEPSVPGRETVNRGDVTAVSKTGADLLGNRRFESISLQRRVRNEPDTAAEIAEISRVQFRQAGRDEYPRRRARYGAPHREYPTPMPQGANESPISSAS